MSSNSNLYHKISLPPAPASAALYSKMYKGFSTKNAVAENFGLYDFDLIKQDLLNHFNIRQGERLMQPEFGTVIWDLLFEPMTEQVKSIILQNVNEIINYDPRIQAQEITITTYETGLQIACSLKFVPYNLTQNLQLRFDQANGLLIQ